MKPKKNARYRLENYSKLFLQLGLALSLLVIYLAINIKSFDRQLSTLEGMFKQEEVTEEIPITKMVEPVKPPPPPPPAPEIIEVVKDNSKVEEVVLEATETDETESVKPVRIDDINEVAEEEEVVADIPFAVIEEAPVYPGCEGTKAQKRKCFNRKINALIRKNFRSDLAKNLGLSPGIKKIFVQFTIDKNGDITNIKTRAPHKSLEKEAVRVIKLLPKMTPGRQRNRNVNVRYMQPIIFKVLE
jgi:periplasmic protein TonB